MSTAEMKQLLERMRNQRKRWLDLDDAGHRVQLIRPTDVEVARHLYRKGQGLRVELEDVALFTVGWDGVTEADLLGSAVGSSDAVDFDRDVWAEYVADRPDWLQACATRIVEMVIEHSEARAQAAKN